jgi:Flp pilus assembly protein TadB
MASTLILIILEFFMIFFLALGYLIRVRGRVDLIAGYREGKIKDQQGLSILVGNALLLLGTAAAVTLILVLVSPDFEVLFFLIFAAIIFPVVSIFSMIRSRRYFKP